MAKTQKEIITRKIVVSLIGILIVLIISLMVIIKMQTKSIVIFGISIVLCCVVIDLFFWYIFYWIDEYEKIK